MGKYSISEIARKFGLSRSTLLYYDRLGLLPPSGRTSSGYRYYMEKDAERLELVCTYRQAGLTLKDIRGILFSRRKPLAKILEHRLQALSAELRELKSKQRLLSEMLKNLVASGGPVTVDKTMWAEMLRAAGMDDDAMSHWHAEFEKRAPREHHDFLSSLGIPEREILEIRKWSAELNERHPR